MRTHCRAERLLTLPRFRDPAEILARRRLIAVAGLLALAAQLLFAPSILILAAAFGLTGRLTRWHPLWLAVPAAAGLLTVLAAGPSRAIAAFAAGSARVAGYFTADAGEPERLLHPLDAYRDARAWLAGQVPLALILAAAEAAGLATRARSGGTRPRIGRGDPLGRSREQDRSPARRGPGHRPACGGFLAGGRRRGALRRVRPGRCRGVCRPGWCRGVCRPGRCHRGRSPGRDRLQVRARGDQAAQAGRRPGPVRRARRQGRGGTRRRSLPGGRIPAVLGRRRVSSADRPAAAGGRAVGGTVLRRARWPRACDREGRRTCGGRPHRGLRGVRGPAGAR